MTYPGAMRRLLLLGALAALALPAGAAAKTIQFSVTSVGKSVVTHDKKPKGARWLIAHWSSRPSPLVRLRSL